MSLIRNKKFNINNILWWLLLFFVFTIPLSQVLSIKIIIAALILSFFAKYDKNPFTQFLFHSWDSLLYILMLLMGLIYSANLNAGLKIIETNLSLVAMPLLFIKIKDFDKHKIYQLGLFFCIGLFIACLFCISHSFLMYRETGDLTVFFFYKLTKIIEFQPTYYAYYLIFGMTCTIYTLYYESVKIPRFLLIISLFFFFSILLLTGGWTAMSSLFFVFSFFILKYFFEKKTKIKSLTIAIIGMMLIPLFLSHVLLDSSIEGIFSNDYWERTVLWKAAIQANVSPILGVGTGDGHQALNAYYQAHGMGIFAQRNYNAHNQFIQTYFSHGLVGLAILLLLLGRPLYLSVKNKKTTAALIFFPFVVYGITEVFLGRYQGIVFFALLYQIFLSYLSYFKTSFSSGLASTS